VAVREDDRPATLEDDDLAALSARFGTDDQSQWQMPALLESYASGRARGRRKRSPSAG